jgi:hypothetical protein
MYTLANKGFNRPLQIHLTVAEKETRRVVMGMAGQVAAQHILQLH